MSMRFLLPLILLAAVSLCGCMKVGPDFKKPVAAKPDSWLEAEYAQSRPDLPLYAQAATPVKGL